MKRPDPVWPRPMHQARRLAAAIPLLAALLAPVVATGAEQRVEVSGGPGIKLSVLYDAAPRPVVSVLLFVGGDGDLAHEQGSFLLRMRQRFLAAGMTIAVPDTPWDHPGGFGPLFRTWTPHIQDVAAIVAFLKRKSPVPIWAVGTSNGTISAASVAAALGPNSIAGVVLTSSVWLGGLGQVPVEKIAVPVLDIQDRDDACPASKLALAEKNMPRFSGSPSTKLLVVSGGPLGGPQCGTGSPHDFEGVESQVIPPIIDWIKASAHE